MSCNTRRSIDSVLRRRGPIFAVFAVGLYYSIGGDGGNGGGSGLVYKYWYFPQRCQTQVNKESPSGQNKDIYLDEWGFLQTENTPVLKRKGPFADYVDRISRFPIFL